MLVQVTKYFNDYAFTLFSLQTTHPLYRHNNKLVPYKDPLCKSLRPPGERKCQIPEQCDNEVQYVDSSSSTGVLAKDAFFIQLYIWITI